MQRKPSSQVTIAYEYLRDQIISYALAPESLISDYKFTKVLEMSRAPIREAILLLEMDGLIVINSEGKVSVAPVRFEDISDILRVRGALESEAISIIADNGWLNKTKQRELLVIHNNMCKSDNFSIRDNYKYDDLFHQKIAEFSKSPRIIDTLDRLTLQMQRVRWLNIVHIERLKSANEEHEAILSAIFDRNLDDAVKLLRLHFKNSEDSFKKVLDDEDLQTFGAMISHFFR